MRNTMTVGELISLLEDFDPDSPVKLAMQPGWPMEYTLRDVISVNLKEQDPEDPMDDEDEIDTVYLVEGEQTGYLPGVVSGHLGWK